MTRVYLQYHSFGELWFSEGLDIKSFNAQVLGELSFSITYVIKIYDYIFNNRAMNVFLELLLMN